MTRQLLGLSAGSVGGNAETLLKKALTAAEAEGAHVSLVRLQELRLTSGPDEDQPDDTPWFWNQLMEADGLIVSSPIYTRALPGRLKLLADKMLGPNADRAIVEQILDMRRKGQEPVVPFHVDERIMRPRVAGFIAVGGALLPRWRIFALPLMHGLTFSMQTAVVDHMVVGGAGLPQSVVMDDAAMTRAARLGSNVATQLGRTFGEAEYVGDQGSCPVCHLDLVALRGQEVICATCGAQGQLRSDCSIAWTDLATSVISMQEKRTHYAEILETATRLGQVSEQITARASEFAQFTHVIRPDRR
jgi:multimeric flavodoxin WrbA